MELATTVGTSQVDSCIAIRNAYKRFSAGNFVLNGLNMTVSKGTVYSLLGPSGCGKTTLMNCIVGCSKLQSGSIELSTNQRSDIGFMPQSLCVYLEFTIEENLIFYGHLFSMKADQIMHSIAKLVDLLDLPPTDRLVMNLSGGQQRRVSLALAFLHNPQILILDEPTVGLDIALTQRIWEQLLKLACQGKTVLITTHYIEEAGKAHRIGMMRNGVLVAEEKPVELLKKCNCSSLDDAFLHYSYKQENDCADNNQLKAPLYPVAKESVKAYYKDDEKVFTRRTLKGVFYKNYTQIMRSYTYIIFVLIFPIFQFLLFYIAFGHKANNLPLAVINDEQIDEQYYKSTSSGCFLDEYSNVSLSFPYINSLRDQSYKIIEYDNLTKAVNDVKKNKVWGALYFPKNFTSTLAEFLNRKKLTEFTYENTIAGMLTVWQDLSGFIGFFIQLDIDLTLLDVFQKAVVKCGLNVKIASLPIQIEEPIYGTNSITLLDYTTPIAQVIFAFAISMMGTGVVGVTEKLGGTIERMLVTGVTVFEILASIVLIQVVICLIQTLMMMVLIYPVLGILHQGSLFLLYWLVFLSGVQGIFFGVFFLVLFNNMMMMMIGCTVLSFFCVIATGVVWPREGQHPSLQWMHYVLPFGYATDAAQAIDAKGFSFTHAIILQGFGISVLWVLILIILTCITLKYKPDIWVLKKY